MKLLHSSRVVEVPEGISLEVKARQVRVKGPRGELDGASSWSQALEAGRRNAAGSVQAVRGVTEAGVEGAGARKCTEQSQDCSRAHSGRAFQTAEQGSIHALQRALCTWCADARPGSWEHRLLDQQSAARTPALRSIFQVEWGAMHQGLWCTVPFGIALVSRNVG